MTGPAVVPGVLAAHVTDPVHRTGVTVWVFPEGARCGVWVPGSATGSRDLGVLDPGHVAGDVHAICLAGGSAYGLSAAGTIGTTPDGIRSPMPRSSSARITPSAAESP